MRITYCIMAHAHPELLRRAISALQSPNVQFVVHVDAKSDIQLFRNALRDLPVVFVEPPCLVTYCGFSMAEAMITTFRTALSLPPSDYYPILSGQCHPVRSNAAIVERLLAANGRNMIGFYPIVPGAKMDWVARRYHFRDWRTKFPTFRYGIKALELIFRRRKLPTDFQIFRGSCWSVLNEETVRYLVDQQYTEYGQRIARFLRYSFASDEMYIQTMVLNSPLAHSCEGYEHHQRTGAGSEREMPWHYIDWSRQREIPALLIDRDWDAIRSDDGDVFARKFALPRSESLLATIDHSLSTK